MTFTVMITTRNRCEDLRRTGRRLAALKPKPLEVLIIADGCTDETVVMVKNEFSGFRLFVNAKPLGSVASRDRLLREAKGDVVISLDDDSYPVSDDFLARLPEIFTAHPEAAVVTFPELRDGEVYSSPAKTPQTPGHYTAAYPNCAAAMRREVYLGLGGYPPLFFHAYEEPDYALQCYGDGHAVWFEPTLTIRHHLSPKNRSSIRFHHFNARNGLWSVWIRCPWPQLPIVSAFRIWRQFRYASSEGWHWVVREPLWWLTAVRGLPQCWRNRKPIRWPAYFAWMRLARNPISNFSELQKVFGIKTK